MNGETRFVDFALYCPKCKYWPKDEKEEPCNDCMSQPTNEYSAKPVCYEPGDGQT